MNAVVIDDEINNVTNLVILLSQHCPAVKVIGTAFNADEGIDILTRHEVDIVFLDIQMPGKNGFEMLSALPSYNFHVVFVTAYDSYAIKAIKYSALDYLLKPIDIDELKTAVKKAGEKSKAVLSEGQLKNLTGHIQGIQPAVETIALPMAGEIRFIHQTDIVYCQSKNNYTLFFLANGEKITVSKGLYEFVSILPETIFFRCHQSYLVNLKYVKSLHKDGSSGYLETNNKITIPVSRSKREEIRLRLGSS